MMVALDCQTLTYIIAHGDIIFQLMDIFNFIVFGRNGDVSLSIWDSSLLNALVNGRWGSDSTLKLVNNEGIVTD